MKSELMVLIGIVCLLGVTAPAAAQVVSLQDIPSPRPNGWSVDLTGEISPDAMRAIDRLGDEAATELGAELAVVVVGSIGNADPRRFATNLFNTWGIGHPSRNNGILIFVALGDRAAELILGDGIDGTPQLSAADDIMQDEMVPRLRQGDPSNAVLAGATASITRILRPLGRAVPAEPMTDSVVEIESRSFSGGQVASVSDPDSNSDSEDDNSFPIFGGLAGLAGLAGAGVGGRKLIRYRTRDCPDCGAACMRLDEAQDDAHLSRAEQVEERIGSVDYDVWACPRCRDVQKFRYGALFTRYSRCPRCTAKTKSKTTTTVRAATYTTGGLVEVEEKCAHCSYHNRFHRSTPVLTRSSSGSGSSSSSGFSGGSSSGGGSSGRW